MASARLQELQTKGQLTPEEQEELQRLQSMETSSEAPVSSLSSKLNPTTPAPAPVATVKDSAKSKTPTVSPFQADKIIEELNALDTRYKQTAGIPSYDRQKLEEALIKARELRDTQTSRNDWLEVGQTLARAVAQYGAAQSGMANAGRYGRDNSNINMGPGINFEARSARAQNEYAQTAREQADLANLDRQRDKDIGDVERTKYSADRATLEDRLRIARDRDKDKQDREQSFLRESKASKEAQLREDQTNKRLEYADLNRQEAELTKQLAAARSLANAALTDSDLNSKSRDKLQEKYGSMAAAAGIDPQVLKEIGEESKDAGIFGTGIFKGEDKEKKAKLIEERTLLPIKTMMDAIKEKKKQLRETGSTNTESQPQNFPGNNVAAGSNSSSQQPAPSATIKVQGPSGQVAEMTREAAAKYLNKPGYKEVK